MARPKANTPPPRPIDLADAYLDYAGVAQTLEDLGFSRPSVKAVKAMADKKKLPFFIHLDGRRYISRQKLIDGVKQMQAAAESEIDSRRRAGRRRAGGGAAARV